MGLKLVYVGPAELHDATIQRVVRDGSELRVELKSAEGRLFALLFTGVTHVDSAPVEGTMIYAVTAEPQGSLRRYCFQPWEEEQPFKLSLIAEGFSET